MRNRGLASCRPQPGGDTWASGSLNRLAQPSTFKQANLSWQKLEGSLGRWHIQPINATRPLPKGEIAEVREPMELGSQRASTWLDGKVDSRWEAVDQGGANLPRQDVARCFVRLRVGFQSEEQTERHLVKIERKTVNSAHSRSVHSSAIAQRSAASPPIVQRMLPSPSANPFHVSLAWCVPPGSRLSEHRSAITRRV